MCFQCIRDKSLLRKKIIRSDCPYIFKSFRILKILWGLVQYEKCRVFRCIFVPKCLFGPDVRQGKSPDWFRNRKRTVHQSIINLVSFFAFFSPSCVSVACLGTLVHNCINLLILLKKGCFCYIVLFFYYRNN